MRPSQALFRRSRSLLQSPIVALKPARRPPGRPPHLPRKDPSTQSSSCIPSAPLSSSATTSSSSNEPIGSGSAAPEASPESPESEEPPAEEPEKSRTRRTRISSTAKESDSLQLPEGLNILWSPESDPPESNPTDCFALPPSDILDEALNNLHIALHPQTQHKSIYASGTSAVEPTLALYCPLEGGDYIVDATVRELARRTDAEVVELDAVQIAAGEWGHFGKAGAAIQLPENPLHFSASPSTLGPVSRSRPEDDDDDDLPPQIFSSPQQMTLTLMTSSSPNSGGRTVVSSPSRRSPSPSKAKVFFDALVNISPKQSVASDASIGSSSSSRPRLIYVRDFQTLAASSSTWYPSLLSAVRQRRRGPISRPLSPVSNPIVIIFGITPPLTPPVSPFSSPTSSSFVNLLMNRHSQSNPSLAQPRPGKSDWTEDSAAEKARERRLRERMRKWEQGDLALHDEIPRLAPGSADGEGKQKPDVVVIGGPRNLSNLPFLPPFLRGSSASPDASDSDNSDDPFFRMSIVVPRRRTPPVERDCRVARRREINELTMRMGVGAVGGILEGPIRFSGEESVSSDDQTATSESGTHRIWDDWSQRVETWSNVRQIADFALGSTVSMCQINDKPTLEPTPVSWDAVEAAWNHRHAGRKLRKSWTKELTSANKTQGEAEEDQDDVDNDASSPPDEVVERIKADPDLDPHEHRLLASIVDPVLMPTSFSQVHLPPHTIDSVRTIVSLPLLYPMAFQQGILKDHAMTGCLLFGPPGTGKTLVVRALAKEAGCRMMVISPSDVMDMYVGEGEKLVKAVFSLARKLSPCVVFLDEIDALFGARMSARESGGAFAHRGVITEFMQEMDGLKTSKENSVVVIGATNRPFDLDDAILRRLPRRLLVDLPGEREREEILKILLRDETLSEDVNPSLLAKRTESFSGSDLKHLCVSAALDAVKETVEVPWSSKPQSTTLSQAPETLLTETPAVADSTTVPPQTPQALPIEPAGSPHDSTPHRVLRLRNFEKALKEITPSSSESLGTLSDLRKWNDEFGEGRKDRKKIHVWGKGRFGFINQDTNIEEGKVSVPATSSHSYNRSKK